jgi:pantoate--beta-alanine ligase
MNSDLTTIRTVADLRRAVARARGPAGDRTVGLVPTMGALHEGHLSLIRRARDESDVVVMSLFVNPTQFGPGEDLERYPREEARDAELAGAAGVDILFAPDPETVYPPGFATTVRVAGLDERLCAVERGADHFDGVATIVTKLLNMVGPDAAYFGQKDAQQAAVVARLVRDLDIPVRIVVCPIVREDDGLAMSSRNVYLDPEDRARAVGLSRALEAAVTAAGSGERDPRTVGALARRELASWAIDPEYVELVSPETLEPVADLDRRVLVAVAARVGGTRLIDNVILDPSSRRDQLKPEEARRAG